MPNNDKPKLYLWLPAAILTLALAVFLYVVLKVPKDAKVGDQLALVAGCTMLILLFGLGVMILINMAINRIDLAELLNEPGTKGASMSRFQLLIFTFVISFSLFLIIVSGTPPNFPKIPTEILTLLGISASTYAVSKGIQASAPPDKTSGDKKNNPPTPPPADNGQNKPKD